MFRTVGLNMPQDYLSDDSALAGGLEDLRLLGPDFVEVAPQRLGVVVGGRLAEQRAEKVRETLEVAGLDYTIHPPLRLNLMDLMAHELQRDILLSSVRFAGSIGAGIAVCHAGKRVCERDTRYSYKEQLAAERFALREIGDLAGELGVTIAVENWCPEHSIIGGEAYTYSLRPSELAEQVAMVDHPAVGICLDVGHAFVAASFCGFDFIEECASAAPLVSHLHLHDNLGIPDGSTEPEPSERRAYGSGDLHLPPGHGAIPLKELFGRVSFPRTPSCCVELPVHAHAPVAKEALSTARELARTDTIIGEDSNE